MKTTTITFKIQTTDKELIQKGAELSKECVSSFIRRSTINKAKELMEEDN